jgi:hypothetical protein
MDFDRCPHSREFAYAGRGDHHAWIPRFDGSSDRRSRTRCRRSNRNAKWWTDPDATSDQATDAKRWGASDPNPQRIRADADADRNVHFHHPAEWRRAESAAGQQSTAAGADEDTIAHSIADNLSDRAANQPAAIRPDQDPNSGRSTDKNSASRDVDANSTPARNAVAHSDENAGSDRATDDCAGRDEHADETTDADLHVYERFNSTPDGDANESHESDEHAAGHKNAARHENAEAEGNGYRDSDRTGNAANLSNWI